METIVEPGPVAPPATGAAVFTGICAIGSGLALFLTWPTPTAIAEGMVEESFMAYRLLMYAFVGLSVLALGGLVVGFASRGLPRTAAAPIAVGLALPWVVWGVATALVDPSQYVDPYAMIDLYPSSPLDPTYVIGGIPPQDVASAALLIAGGVWMIRQRAVSP